MNKRLIELQHLKETIKKYNIKNIPYLNFEEYVKQKEKEYKKKTR